MVNTEIAHPVRETFSYGIRHILLRFNEVWPYASLNHNEIYRIQYENTSRTGLCIRDFAIFVFERT